MMKTLAALTSHSYRPRVKPTSKGRAKRKAPSEVGRVDPGLEEHLGEPAELIAGMLPAAPQGCQCWLRLQFLLTIMQTPMHTMWQCAGYNYTQAVVSFNLAMVVSAEFVVCLHISIIFLLAPPRHRTS